MKKRLIFLVFLVIAALFVFNAVSAEGDWLHPYATVTSSANITWMESRMLNRVIRMNEGTDGWFGIRTEEDSNVTLSVQLDPAWNTSFSMEIYINDEYFFSWNVLCNGKSQSLALGWLSAGTEITWWDYDPNTRTTQTSSYLMLVEAEKGAVSSAATPAPTAEPSPSPKPEMILNGTIKKGDRFLMGYYEQDNNRSNGREPIEWTILDINSKDDTAFVISTKALECIQYHTSNRGRVKWGDSSVRLWLNYAFFFDAFNPYERDCVAIMNISNVADHVTLLDKEQINKYGLASNGCDVTDYSKARGVEIGNDNGKGCWWVRMTETNSNRLTMFVGIHGKVYEKNEVTVTNNGVRPAMTVSISALQNCPRVTDYSSRPMWNLAFANQAIATRSGPTQAYAEVNGFEVPYGMPVNILRNLTTNDVPWVEVEFIFQGEWIRVWTGLKRFDKASNLGVHGDYEVLGSGRITDNTPGKYGPGNEYRTMYNNVVAGTEVEILSRESGWCLVQYNVSTSKLIMRTWVPENRVM